VVVTSLDRIALNTGHLLQIIESLDAARATLKALASGIDTSTPHRKIIQMLLCAISDFERQIREKDNNL